MNQKRLVLCLALMAVLFAGCQEPQSAAEENGGTETLKYVSSPGAEEFTFYTNDELCELALAYYRLTGGAADQNLTAGAEGNEDGMVNIQAYENLGDHNSTAAGYVIDRLTGKGTDANAGETVDLTVSLARKPEGPDGAPMVFKQG